MVENNSIELTEQETELYDRQIRLWGLDSQKRYVCAIQIEMIFFVVWEHDLNNKIFNE